MSPPLIKGEIFSISNTWSRFELYGELLPEVLSTILS